MYQFAIKKEDLLPPLLTVAGAVDKKQSLAILSNFLLKLSNKQLVITGTDLEIEILSLLMVLEYLNPKIIATENMNQFLTTKEYKIYSQANHLSKMLELKNQIKSEVNHLMSQYSYKDGLGGLN